VESCGAVARHPADLRYVFADGRPFPVRVNGLNTIDRWQQDAFVATTRGFTPGMTGFGRGWTEPTTELIEIFSLSPDRDRVIITYQWNAARSGASGPNRDS
jgi:hypothetical protein